MSPSVSNLVPNQCLDIIGMPYLLAPEGGDHTSEEHFIEKKIKMQGPFFQSHTCIPNKQKQRDVVSKRSANIYPCNVPYVYY